MHGLDEDSLARAMAVGLVDAPHPSAQDLHDLHDLHVSFPHIAAEPMMSGSTWFGMTDQKAYFNPNCMVRERWASMGCRNALPARQLASPAEKLVPP
jgi:hypothetical protein